MLMPKFFINKEQVENKSIIIVGEDANHINVLRYRVGDTLEICDGDYLDYVVQIESISKNEVITKIVSECKSESEPKVKITLFQALPKKDKMELIIQKCVELGIYEIVTVVTDNSIVKQTDKYDNKIERWQKISETAAKQSGRSIIPKITKTITFNAAVERLKNMDKSFLAYEKEEKLLDRDIFSNKSIQNIGLFIGSEGGFSKEEVDICKDNGIYTISLGSRILRTETAGFTALIILLFLNGDIA
jgi:16S rRNA (uracil1498-N3)-methyltransferase